ncbi:bifunctional folylpolyglutamate synthase/dihydrofolate synthase, partial [bacterium]|nr:bifunctional folylpolyglutamate synthase/dihydrofolate synthase [bacterium]
SFASEEDAIYATGLLGEYQKKNSKTAVHAVRKVKGFQISEEHINNGLLNVVQNTNLKGRWQVLQENPKVICDTAHNKEGLSLVLQQLEKESFQKVHIVLGVVEDKKLAQILPLFPSEAIYYFCKPDIPRGLSEKDLQEKAAEFHLLGERYSSVLQALESALLNANQQDIIYVGGSTFVVAEII